MTRLFTGQRLVVATHNAGKLREFAALLKDYVPQITSAGELGLPEPDEIGATFHANALLKAQSAARLSGEVALADDSGLCVTGLDHRPGIYSARWAAIHGADHQQHKDAANMALVNQQLADSQDRSAYFICVLVLAWPDGHSETVEGRINGTLCWPPRGDKGHGYDPIFVPKGYTETFAEMQPAAKNAISHRAMAMQALRGIFAVMPLVDSVANAAQRQ